MRMLDIGRIQHINGTLGHGMGDVRLKAVGSAPKSGTRECDTLARWGGDEFVLLLPGLQDSSVAVAIAQRCLESLKEPFVVDGQELRITASIGISLAADSSAG